MIGFIDLLKKIGDSFIAELILFIITMFAILNLVIILLFVVVNAFQFWEGVLL